MQRFKDVGLLIACLLTLSVVISGCRPERLLKPTPTCSYGWGPYTGKDVPDWTAAWKEVISHADLEVKDVRVQGIGETSFIYCGGKATESWERAYLEIQATITVEDVKNLDTLGDTMVKVYRAVKILITNEKGLAEANLSILFASRKDQSEVMRCSFNHNLGIVMIARGKNGRELFEATCGKPK
jgi:hypothetical protein